jgi:AraC-like DNA-binding protein
MDEMQNFRLLESPLSMRVCNTVFEAEALIFEPVSGFYFGACGPVQIVKCYECEFTCDIPMIMLFLLLDGEYHVEFQVDNPYLITLKKNNFIISEWNNTTAKSIFPIQNSYCHVALSIKFGAITNNFGKSVENNIIKLLHTSFNKKSYGIPAITGLASPALISSGKRIFNIFKDSIIDNMEMRGAALDFLSKLIQQASQPVYNKYVILHDYDIHKLTNLKQFIENNYLKHISLSEYYSSAEMSESKANNGFKKLFNMTISKYIHTCKMQYAHEMLSAKKLNVSECAFALEYTNIGHFIAAFRRHYGLTPGEILRSSS